MGIVQSRVWRALAAGSALLLVAAGGIAAWHLAAPTAGESIAAEALRARGHAVVPAALDPATAAAASRPLTVYVSGAVLHPGMFQLPRGSRIADAVEAAGGLAADADPNKLPNMAGRLTDGKQVKVARRGATTSTALKVDINSAGLDELLAVPGIDESLAQAIIDEREGYGPFLSLTELHTVLGLDTQVVAALRPYLKVLVP